MKLFHRHSLCLVLVSAFAPPAAADVITDWNHTAVAVMKAANTGGNPSTRNLALMHVAMSDAVNSVQNRFAIYAAGGASAPGASPEAAAAAAARSILLQQLPGQKAAIEQAFEASIKTIPDGAAKKDGIAIGEQVRRGRPRRACNGRNHRSGYLSACHHPGRLDPHGAASVCRICAGKALGHEERRPVAARHRRPTSRARSTPATTTRPRTWAAQRAPSAQPSRPRRSSSGRGEFGVLAGRRRATLSAAKKLSLAENARLYALLNMGIANTFIIDWDAKFTYNFWRPVTAIRNGDQDGNDATERDAGWTSLNATPMHPEYPSQAAIIAGVSTGIFESVFGANPSTPVVVSDVADPKIQRRYANIQQLAEEIRNVRVWGGIHFRTSVDVGYDMGRKIAVFLVENSIKPTN